MEDEIKKTLEGVTKLCIFPATTKVVIMKFEHETYDDFGLKMSKEQFMEFRERLKSKGFIEVEFNGRSDINSAVVGVLKPMLLQLGYDIRIDNRRRGLWYVENSGKKLIAVNYTLGDEVTIKSIVYFEKS